MTLPAEAPPLKKKFRFHAQQMLAQELMASDCTDIGVGGGARSGKTFNFIYAIVTRALRAPKTRHAIIRFRQNAVIKSVVMDTFPNVMEKCYPGLYNERNLNKTLWFYTLPNGSEIWFGGLDDKEQVEKILGTEFITMYFNESSQIPYQSISTALTRLAQVHPELAQKAYYDFNPPGKKHWTYVLFIDKKNPATGKPLLKPMDYGFLFMNPMDNRENLSRAFLERLDALPPKERKRYFLGQFGEASQDSLWTEELYEQQRFLPSVTRKLPDMVRVIVAVDPSGCEGEEDTRSDEIGIVVMGLGTDNNGYLLEDLTGRYGPSTWGDIVSGAYERHRADSVIGERNYGGAMVSHVIATANDKIPVKLVTASRGKVVRAAPVAALYQKGRIFHVGYFPEMEEQGLNFFPNGYQGMKSPDRKDALVWGATELFSALVSAPEGEGDWTPPGVLVPARAASAHRR